MAGRETQWLRVLLHLCCTSTSGIVPTDTLSFYTTAASCPILSLQTTKKYNSSAFKLLLPCRIFLGCLILETTSAPVCFQRGEPSRSSWLSVRTHADVHETLSPSASVCLGPRPWLIMAHYCSPSPVLFTVDWLFVDFSHIPICWESLHSGYF